MTDAADKTAKLLAALWERNRPLVEERVAVLDRVSEGAEAGLLGEDLRKEGIGAAHKLAGALGMYGYDEGTRVAREIELLLGGAAADAMRLKKLCGELRAAVFPNP